MSSIRVGELQQDVHEKTDIRFKNYDRVRSEYTHTRETDGDGDDNCVEKR